MTNGGPRAGRLRRRTTSSRSQVAARATRARTSRSRSARCPATGNEPTFSMGDDTPIPPLAQRSRPVTSSYASGSRRSRTRRLDHLREGWVMSLRTLLGAAPRAPGRGPRERPDRRARQLLCWRPSRRSRGWTRRGIRSDGADGLARRAPATRPRTRPRRRRREPTPRREHAAPGGTGADPVRARRRCGPHGARRTRPAPALLDRRRRRRCVRFASTPPVSSPAGPTRSFRRSPSRRSRPCSSRDACQVPPRPRRCARRTARRRGGRSQVDVARSASRCSIRYRGARALDALGLADEVIDRCFPGVVSPIGGLGFRALGEQVSNGGRSRSGTDARRWPTRAR